MTRARRSLAVALAAALAACGGKDEPDAYGNVEAIEVVVGAEAAGRIQSLAVEEGAELPAGAVVGAIDTSQLSLERTQVTAQRAASASRVREIAQQASALEVQRRIAGRTYARTRRLHEKRAATAQQLDQAQREYEVLGEQLDAARAQAETVRRESEAAEARVAQVSDRIGKAAITNPVAGTVLAVYARAGETAQVGQPLYRIADLRTVEVRAYVVETQLASVRVGREVRVSVDVAEGERRALAGTVTWVSAEAEFTPTPVQTREERADLVYAVKIRVPNPDGLLKIGMPADVDLEPGASS